MITDEVEKIKGDEMQAKNRRSLAPRLRNLLIVAPFLVISSFGVSGAAVADSSDSFADQIADIPGAAQVVVDEQSSVEEKAQVGFDDKYSSTTPEWNMALIKLDHSSVGSILNSVEWSQDSGYTIYVHGDAGEAAEVLSEFLPTDGWSVVESKYSKDELLKEADRILAAPELLGDEKLTVIGPKHDGSGLRLGLVGDPDAKSHSTSSSLESTYPIEISYRAPLETTSRQADSAPYKAGAIINSIQGDFSHQCTTAFKVGTGSPIVSSLLTADHCSDTGWEWKSGQATLGLGTNVTLGYGQGQVSSLDVERIGSSVNPSGLPSTAPYVYVGSAGPTGGITGIYGYTSSPVIGSSVCMSGGFTGQVCNNTVTAVDQIACKPFPTTCWYHQTVSLQQDNAPAAGSGDSGGPVIMSIGGRAYATGIISAIGPLASTCIGQPGRKCSTEVSWTPIQRFFTESSGAVIFLAGPS